MNSHVTQRLCSFHDVVVTSTEVEPHPNISGPPEDIPMSSEAANEEEKPVPKALLGNTIGEQGQTMLRVETERCLQI